MQPVGPSVLFAYGTLMSWATSALGVDMRARLKREARSLGAATTAGRLYSLGAYPGLTEPLVATDVVHGEAIRLHATNVTLKWLDEYEGIAPGHERANEYARIVRPIRLANGTQIEAWLYVYLADISQARRVPGGRWTK